MSEPGRLRPTRRQLLGTGAAAWAAAWGWPAAATEPDAQRLLAASDAVRNPPQPFSMTVQLLEYRSGKLHDSSTVEVFARADSQGGQYATVLRFVAPARDAGKLMLKQGNDLWFFDPASQASIRISPQQRLLGQASNGDVVTANLARDYRAGWQAEEEIVDGERVRRRSHRLELVASSPEVTYARVVMWIDADSAWPLKSLFHAESGRLLKTAYYRKFKPWLGNTRPTEVVIIDGLEPGWVTVLRYSDFKTRRLPEAWFHRDHLPHFDPD